LRWREYLETYSNWVDRFLHSSASSETVQLIRVSLLLLVLQFALVAVIFITAGMLARLDYTRFSPVIDENKTTLLWASACLLTVPNAIMVFFRARTLGRAMANALIPTKVAETLWAQSFGRITCMLFAIAGLAVLFFESVMLSGTIMPEQGWARTLVVGTLLVVGMLGWKRFWRMGSESLKTLRGVLTSEMETDPAESAADLLDIHAEKIRVGRTSDVCGLSLRNIDLRAKVGASVIGIERAGLTIVNPKATETLEAADVVLVLGDDEQIARARILLA